MRGIIVLFVLSFLFMKRGIQEIRFKRKYSSYPVSKIRSLSAGRVKVKGKLKEIDKSFTRLSQLSNESCLMYIYEIDVYRYGYIKRGYEEVFYSGDWSKFLVDDGTGSILIDSPYLHGRLLKPKYIYKQNIFKKLPTHFDEFLAKHNIKTKYRLGFRKAIRIREYQLSIGDEVNVVGYAAAKTEELKRVYPSDQNLYLTGTDEFSLVFTQSDKSLFNEFISSLWFLIGAAILVLALVGFVVKFE